MTRRKPAPRLFYPMCISGSYGPRFALAQLSSLASIEAVIESSCTRGPRRQIGARDTQPDLEKMLDIRRTPSDSSLAKTDRARKRCRPASAGKSSIASDQLPVRPGRAVISRPLLAIDRTWLPSRCIARMSSCTGPIQAGESLTGNSVISSEHPDGSRGHQWRPPDSKT